ncbi:hypothetical protein ACLQ28_19190 [Micromonospora sp. DT201]|uniref:hypothetical protein n=1 Tax=Micromonospora sp. DT201 TaxID=3393442 RepID=UPI003CECA668
MFSWPVDQGERDRHQVGDVVVFRCRDAPMSPTWCRSRRLVVGVGDVSVGVVGVIDTRSAMWWFLALWGCPHVADLVSILWVVGARGWFAAVEVGVIDTRSAMWWFLAAGMPQCRRPGVDHRE